MASRTALLLAPLALLAGLQAADAIHAQIGTPVPDREMPTLSGGRARLLGVVGANVMVFFRPGQERSEHALGELARCQEKLAEKSVRWVAVVSDSASTEGIAALVSQSKWSAPVLVDEGDALYGSLGVALHPVLVIVDRDSRLAVFEPFRTLNFCQIVTARIRHVLKQITDDELREAIDPPPQKTRGTELQVARRYATLAEALLRDAKYDKALEFARKGLKRDDTSPALFALLGDILRAQGNCKDALPAFEKALGLEPANSRAKSGVESCKPAR